MSLFLVKWGILYIRSWAIGKYQKCGCSKDHHKIDEGKARNLRRNSTDPSKEHSSRVVPGTDYTVAVAKVLKGTIESNSEIKVAVGGGSYKGKKANLRATLIENEEYIFALAPSGSGHPNYYGLIEPFIFQVKNNKIEAVNNIDKYKAT